MKKLLYILIFFPIFSFSQEFKIEHKANDDKTVDFRYQKSKPNSKNKVDVSDFVDHIDYLVGLIGINHVGISSDFDGGGGIDGWEDASETFNVTLELVKRGYSEVEIEKIWSGNLLRVLDEVSQISKKIQKI